MTEASHQMASNPFPRVRKPGTVGQAAPASRSSSSTNRAGTYPRRVPGEVSIRGRNVMHGYHNNLDANAQAFSGGFFRTGDQGPLDADGYLTLTGRLKELINRGGERSRPSRSTRPCSSTRRLPRQSASPRPTPSTARKSRPPSS